MNLAGRDAEDLLESIVGEDDPAARSLGDQQAFRQLLEEGLEASSLRLEIGDQSLADARERDPGEGLRAEVGVGADERPVVRVERPGFRERQSDDPERDAVGEEGNRAERAVSRPLERGPGPIVVSLRGLNVRKPDRDRLAGRARQRRGRRHRRVRVRRNHLVVIAVARHDDERVVLAQGDQCPARAEGRATLADDEGGNRVARHSSRQVARDALQPRDPLRRGLGRAAGGLLGRMNLAVRDGQCDATGELGRDLDLRRTVLPVRPDDEEHRTDRFAAGDQRLDDRASGLHRPDDSCQGLVVGRVAGEDLGVLEIGQEDRPPLTDGAGRRARRIGGSRKVADPIEDRLLGCVLGHRRDPPKAAVGLDQVDDAEVGEVGDRQRGGGLDRLGEVAGLVEP